MKFYILAILLILTSCGQDLAKKSRRTPTDGSNQTGVSGDNPLINSQINRIRGAVTLTYTQEIAQTISGTLPATYKRIPDLGLDDEGTSGKNVVTVTSLGRPGTECGIATTFTGIAGRLADCLSKNGTLATWVGQNNASNGEATWRLVAFNATTSREYWQDLRTGMIWSDVIGTANWCKASGNTQENVGSTINCALTGEGQSLCAGTNLDTFGTNIIWRLPTRGDYLQADLDGFRFVMKTGISTPSWTATLEASSTTHENAWGYIPLNGTLQPLALTTEQHVRCIGTPAN